MKKYPFDIVIERFLQPLLSLFFEGESGNTWFYSPLKKGVVFTPS
jgi:hypothetical protein